MEILKHAVLIHLLNVITVLMENMDDVLHITPQLLNAMKNVKMDTKIVGRMINTILKKYIKLQMMKNKLKLIFIIMVQQLQHLLSMKIS